MMEVARTWLCGTLLGCGYPEKSHSSRPADRADQAKDVHEKQIDGRDAARRAHLKIADEVAGADIEKAGEQHSQDRSRDHPRHETAPLAAFTKVTVTSLTLT